MLDWSLFVTGQNFIEIAQTVLEISQIISVSFDIAMWSHDLAQGQIAYMSKLLSWRFGQNQSSGSREIPVYKFYLWPWPIPQWPWPRSNQKDKIGLQPIGKQTKFQQHPSSGSWDILNKMFVLWPCPVVKRLWPRSNILGKKFVSGWWTNVQNFIKIHQAILKIFQIISLTFDLALWSHDLGQGQMSCTARLHLWSCVAVQNFVKICPAVLEIFQFICLTFDLNLWPHDLDQGQILYLNLHVGQV